MSTLAWRDVPILDETLQLTHEVTEEEVSSDEPQSR